MFFDEAVRARESSTDSDNEKDHVAQVWIFGAPKSRSITDPPPVPLPQTPLGLSRKVTWKRIEFSDNVLAADTVVLSLGLIKFEHLPYATGKSKALLGWQKDYKLENGHLSKYPEAREKS